MYSLILSVFLSTSSNTIEIQNFQDIHSCQIASINYGVLMKSKGIKGRYLGICIAKSIELVPMAKD